MYDKVLYIMVNRFKRGSVLIRNSSILIKQCFFQHRIAPSGILIELINKCNANCIFCSYQFNKNNRSEMDEKTLIKVLEEAKSLNIPYIDLTPLNGENLIIKNISEKIRLIASYRFQVISMYTNLLLLHKHNIEDFLNSGLTELHISCAPLRKDLYEKIFRVNKYEVFLENLIELLKAFNKIQHKTVKKLSIEFRSNIGYKECLNLEDYKKYIEPLVQQNKKAIKIVVMRVFDSWMGTISEQDLLPGMIIKKANGRKFIPCSRLNFVQILSNGDIRLCGCRINYKSDTDVFKVGNINNISLIDAYNSDTAKKLKLSFLHGGPEECRKCSWYE